MENVEKDVVLDEVRKEEKFKKLLEKVCKDFKVKDYKEEIEKFLKNRQNSIWKFSHFLATEFSIVQKWLKIVRLETIEK